MTMIIYIFSKIDSDILFVCYFSHINFVNKLTIIHSGCYLVDDLYKQLNRKFWIAIVINVDYYLYISFTVYLACCDGEFTINNRAERNCLVA